MKHRLFGITGILVIACLIRLPGIRYGLPFLYLADETYVVQATGQLARGNFQPEYFTYPLLYSALLIFAYGVYFFVALFAGLVNRPADFLELYFSHPAYFYLAARLISLIFGLLTIWALYRLGKMAYNRRAGLLAAGLGALLPSLYNFSRIGKVETLFCFTVIMAMYYTYRVWKGNRWKDNILAGIFAGLAVGTKYNGAMIILPILLSHIFRRTGNSKFGIRKFHPGKLLISLALLAATALPFFPFCYIGLGPGLRLLTNLRRSLFVVGGPADLMDYSQTLSLFLGNLVAATGIVLTLTIVGLLIYNLFRGSRKEWFFLAPFLAAALPLTASGYPVVRYYLPWLLIVLVPLGGLGDRILGKVKSPRRRNGLLFISAAIILIQPAGIIAHRIRLSANTDTRTLAYRWVVANLKEGTRIALENNIPPIKSRAEGGVPDCGLYQTVQIPNYYQDYYSGTNWILKTEEDTPDLEALRAWGVEVVIVNSSNFGKYELYPEKFPRRLGFYRTLAENTLLLKEIPRQPDTRMGPGIKIYRISKSLDPPPPGSLP